MDINVNGIVIASIDSGEADKIITLLTRELGKIKVKVRGVKKSSAKLKFAGQVLSFINCNVIKRGVFYTMTTASSVHSFLDIYEDLEKISGSMQVLEIANKVCLDGKGGDIFNIVIRAIEKICYEENVDISVINFVREILEHDGYSLIFDKCIRCGGDIDCKQDKAFDLAGGVKCEKCFDSEDKSIKKETLKAGQFILNNELDDLNSNDIINVKKTVLKMIEHIYACKLKTLSSKLI